jgi:hypothetical protein
MTVNSCIFTREIYNHGRVGAYTDKFHKWQCIFECRQEAQEIKQKHTSSFHPIIPANERLPCKAPRIADVTNSRERSPTNQKLTSVYHMDPMAHKRVQTASKSYRHLEPT